ncbi:MAG: rhodanese-like domain-containing protein [Silvanigrellaceae bacterium]
MTEFSLATTMKEVETTFPFARAMLHAKFHVGGCASCGFEPTETIAEVAQKHGKNAPDMLEELNSGIRDMFAAQIDAHEAEKLLKSTDDVLLVDVREPWEFEICKLGEKAILLNEKTMPLVFEQGQSAKHVIVYCHHGVRSLNAALYLRQNGLPNAVSLKGGIDKFAQSINPGLPRY